MNIGLLIYDLRSGGAERVLCKWSDLLIQENRVFLYTYDGTYEPEYSYSGKLQVLNVPSKGRKRFRKYQCFTKLKMKN